jgi:hypothetical protein
VELISSTGKKTIPYDKVEVENTLKDKNSPPTCIAQHVESSELDF